MPKDTDREQADSQFASAHQAETNELPRLLGRVLAQRGMSPRRVAELLGSSHIVVTRWARGEVLPSARQIARLQQLAMGENSTTADPERQPFQARGARALEASLTDSPAPPVPVLAPVARRPILAELMGKDGLWADSGDALSDMLNDSAAASSVSPEAPLFRHVSAGKNTYTYDAHTYHTKVPPQGIAQILAHYLPRGGVVLDPFAGSGMTAVAARSLGLNAILNELSPAASFISWHFTHSISVERFDAGLDVLRRELAHLRSELYGTDCRECGSHTEIQYTVWSYSVECYHCNSSFVLWDHCRSYGRTVREHKLLSAFPCPVCSNELKKSKLRRSTSEPVLLGYRCCQKQQVEHAPSATDRERIQATESLDATAAWVPSNSLPDGVNLRQPKTHGITSVDKFYTGRNLRALSALWDIIHRLEDRELAGFLAFAATSLYQRVTRLSEYRFWGGSGNTARFNVPFIWNEANVFATFDRKARSIRDHLVTTGTAFTGKVALRTGSATNLSFLPDASVDLVFTDPPFGANINYSDMNFLWEAWLETFTDTTDEAIVNRVQGKDVSAYGKLMSSSLKECHRVLKPGGRLVLIFMNSSEAVWSSLRDAITAAGFVIGQIDLFDKQHSTFKMYVSENTAGSDLIIHCERSVDRSSPLDSPRAHTQDEGAVCAFLEERYPLPPRSSFLHVLRESEIDYRFLYGDFMASSLGAGGTAPDFARFRAIVDRFYSSSIASPTLK